MKASKLPPLPRVVNKLVVLGRHIGTYSHCDQFDTSSFTFYDFIPVSDFNGSLLEQSSISIEFELGEIKSYNDAKLDSKNWLSYYIFTKKRRKF